MIRPSGSEYAAPAGEYIFGNTWVPGSTPDIRKSNVESRPLQGCEHSPLRQHGGISTYLEGGRWTAPTGERRDAALWQHRSMSANPRGIHGAVPTMVENVKVSFDGRNGEDALGSRLALRSCPLEDVKVPLLSRNAANRPIPREADGTHPLEISEVTCPCSCETSSGPKRIR